MYYSKCNFGYILRLEMGEELQDSLRQFAEEVRIKGAFYQGVGTLTQVELAFFQTQSPYPEKRFFPDEYELILCQGNLSFDEKIHLPHTHVTLGDRHFQTYSGHLIRATVAITVELLLFHLDLPLFRREDPFLQYKSLVFPHQNHLKIES